jgi:hypothetical protein
MKHRSRFNPTTLSYLTSSHFTSVHFIASVYKYSTKTSHGEHCYYTLCYLDQKTIRP